MLRSLLCGTNFTYFANVLTARLFGDLELEEGDADTAEEGAPLAPPAEPSPELAFLWELEELSILRRAHSRGAAEGGLTRAHFQEGFGAHLPTCAVDRLFASLARPVVQPPPPTPANELEGEGRGEAEGAAERAAEGAAALPQPPQLRVSYADLVDGLARACKSPSAARTRLIGLFDLFASEHARPSDQVLLLDAEAEAADAFRTEATYRGAFSRASGYGFEGEREERDPLESARPTGALDEAALLALLCCCLRQCCEPAQCDGAHLDLAPLIADAYLNGPLSRAAWLRWAGDALPRLGGVLELLVLRAVRLLARVAEPGSSEVRLAEATFLPLLLGGEPAEEGRVDSISPLLLPALLWAVQLSLPPDGGSGAGPHATPGGRRRAESSAGPHAEPGGGGGLGARCASSNAPSALTADGARRGSATGLHATGLLEGWPDTWRRLYSSSEHGLSVNRFSHHVLGYDGPTLLVVQEAPPLGSRSASSADSLRPEGSSPILGGAEPPPPPPLRWAMLVDEPWRGVSPGCAFGGDGCVAYSLGPRFHAHRIDPLGPRQCASLVLPVHALLATSHHRDVNVHRGEGEAAHISFGGGAPTTPRTPATPSGEVGEARAKRFTFEQSVERAEGGRRAELSADLTRSQWHVTDETFESDAHRLQAAGELADRPQMRVAMVEVWGLGGPAADSAQSRVQAEAERARVRAARVGRKGLRESWTESPDRMLLELGGRSSFAAHPSGATK